MTARSPERDAFLAELRAAASPEHVRDHCRRRVLHGTPHAFAGREDAFYQFRKRIATQIGISIHEVYITGSAKLGFSLFEDKNFDLDSDIDVALVAPTLFDTIMAAIERYQYSLRESRRSVTERELAMYHQFLEYAAIGWIRPDKIPISFDLGTFKGEWFAFFESISADRSEVGNYHVSAGVFKRYAHLEEYQFRGLLRLQQTLRVEDAR